MHICATVKGWYSPPRQTPPPRHRTCQDRRPVPSPDSDHHIPGTACALPYNTLGALAGQAEKVRAESVQRAERVRRAGRVRRAKKVRRAENGRRAGKVRRAGTLPVSVRVTPVEHQTTRQLHFARRAMTPPDP
jgi:hypothetical protein